MDNWTRSNIETKPKILIDQRNLYAKFNLINLFLS